VPLESLAPSEPDTPSHPTPAWAGTWCAVPPSRHENPHRPLDPHGGSHLVAEAVPCAVITDNFPTCSERQDVSLWPLDPQSAFGGTAATVTCRQAFETIHTRMPGAASVAVSPPLSPPKLTECGLSGRPVWMNPWFGRGVCGGFGAWLFAPWQGAR
jgi:hypothetical protein